MNHRILIANRGEIALRSRDACKRLGLDYVMIYTQQDAESLHAQEANTWRVSRYDDPNEILEAADGTGCTAIYLGYGLLSENWRFIRRCVLRERVVIPIAPDWQVVRDLGSKINTKRISNKLGIPTVPGSTAPIRNVIEAEEIARNITTNYGPDILIKASTGGAGRGIYDVKGVGQGSFDELALKFTEAMAYSRKHFHDDNILIEHCFSKCNHIEVQILGDKEGEIVHFGTRNCSIQSPMRQKRIEVAPAFDMKKDYGFDPEAVMKKAVNYAMRIGKNVHYDNVGTCEYLVTPEGGLYLLEINTRIQVENDVSGRISQIGNGDVGVNIIDEQIRIALGQPLGYKQKDISLANRSSIEFRIVAEDADKDFEPWVGTISMFEFPKYPWAQVYTHIPDKPYKIITDYDPNLALVVVWGDSIDEAKERGLRFLGEIRIEGTDADGRNIVTNLEYLIQNTDRLLEF